jgi:hypothetical protein
VHGWVVGDRVAALLQGGEEEVWLLLMFRSLFKGGPTWRICRVCYNALRPCYQDTFLGILYRSRNPTLMCTHISSSTLPKPPTPSAIPHNSHNINTLDHLPTPCSPHLRRLNLNRYVRHPARQIMPQHLWPADASLRNGKST